jgi:ankyrin repeat protein
MHLAAQFGSLRCLRLLLERGADPTIRDAAHGGTPLGWAEHGGAHDAAALLRAAGAR